MYIKMKLASELARNQMYQNLLGFNPTNLDYENDKNSIRKLQTFYSLPNYIVPRNKILKSNSQTDTYLALLYMEYQNHKEIIKGYSENQKYYNLNPIMDEYDQILGNVSTTEELRFLITKDLNVWLLILRVSAATLLEKLPCYQTPVEAARWVYNKMNPFAKEDKLLLDLMNPQDDAAKEEIDFNKFFFEPSHTEGDAIKSVQSMLNSYRKFSKSYETLVLRMTEEYVVDAISKLEQNPTDAKFEKNILKRLLMLQTQDEIVSLFSENEELQKRILRNYYQQGVKADKDFLENRARIMDHSKTYQKIKRKMYPKRKENYNAT